MFDESLDIKTEILKEAVFCQSCGSKERILETKFDSDKLFVFTDFVLTVSVCANCGNTMEMPCDYQKYSTLVGMGS